MLFKTFRHFLLSQKWNNLFCFFKSLRTVAVKLYGASNPWWLVNPGDLHAYEVPCQDAALGPVTMLWEPLALKTQFYQLSLISLVSASCPNPKEQKTVLYTIIYYILYIKGR